MTMLMCVKLLCSKNEIMKYKKIASLEQYEKYCNLHEKYGLTDKVKYKDDLELLEILIEEYDNRTSSYTKSLTPVEILASIMQEDNISKAELARDLGTTRQLISDILRYRRNISKNMVAKLSERFAMRPEAFSRPYKLKLKKQTVAV